MNKINLNVAAKYFKLNFKSLSTAIEIKSAGIVDIQNQSRQELEELNAPVNFPPSFNLAAYVNKSESLTKFVELGVDLSKIEKRKGLAQFILKLDFERDVKEHLTLLHDLGLPADRFGEFLTKNPLIFKETINDLETRIYYLQSKKYSIEQIRTIVEKNPFWLMFSTRRIDGRLGYFQRNFSLDGDDIRFLSIKQPNLITYNMEHIQKSTFSVKEEMGFDKDEIKCLLLSKPKLWMLSELLIILKIVFPANL